MGNRLHSATRKHREEVLETWNLHTCKNILNLIKCLYRDLEFPDNPQPLSNNFLPCAKEYINILNNIKSYSLMPI